MDIDKSTDVKFMDTQAEKVKVLFITPWWEIGAEGGVTSVIKEIIQKLSGYQAIVLAQDWKCRKITRFESDLGYYYKSRFSDFPPQTALFLKKIIWPLRILFRSIIFLRFCRSHNIQLCHLHYVTASFAFIALARKFGGPRYIVTLHGTDTVNMNDSKGIPRLLYKWILANACKIIAVSNFISVYMKAIPYITKQPKVIYNGVSSLNHKELSLTELHSLIGKRLPERFIVIAASLRHVKGQDRALKAWRLVQEATQDLHLLLVGGGPEKDNIETLIQQLDLDKDRVWVLGAQSRHVTRSIIRYAEMLLAPSRREGMSIVILEAGLTRTPVICSDIMAFREIITHGETGLLFNVGDSEGLAAQIIRYYNAPAFALKTANNLKEKVERNFTQSLMTEQYEGVYIQCLEQDASNLRFPSPTLEGQTTSP